MDPEKEFDFNVKELPNTSIPALICGEAQVSFAELKVRIEALCTRSSETPSVKILSARSTIEFVVELLAALGSKRPAIVLPSDLPEVARVKLLQQVTASTLHSETALILFTSGSAGDAKAVQLSLANIGANIRAVREALHFSETREQTLFLPLHYSFGLLGQLLPALASGMTTRLLNGFSEIPQTLASQTFGTMWSGVPAHWQTLLRLFQNQEDCERLTHIISAGAPLSFELRAQLKQKFPNATVYNNYGLTEAAPRVLNDSSRSPQFFKSGVGYPVQGIEVRLNGAKELCIRGPQIMLGYLGDSAATAEKITDGWFNTGDLAEISEGGLVTILGRTDDLFKISGERTSINEIENALMQTGFFIEVALVLTDDVLYGKKINALLVWTGSKKISKQKIRDTLAPLIASFKIPSRYFETENLPRLKSGKLDRAATKELIFTCTEVV